MQPLAAFVGVLLSDIIADAVGLSVEDCGHDIDDFMVRDGFALKERGIHYGSVEGYEHIVLRFVVGCAHGHVVSVPQWIAALFSA